MNRLFVGTFLNEAERKHVDELIGSKAHLAERWGKSFRFMRPEKLHLTWMFLGNCDEKSQEKILEILEKTAGNSESHLIEYDRFAIWPKERFPRVGVLLASNPPETFVDIVQKMQTEIRPLLLDKNNEHEKFRPHVTLVRFNAKCFSFSDFQGGDYFPLKQQVKEVSLIRSDLKIYETIESFKLK